MAKKKGIDRCQHPFFNLTQIYEKIYLVYFKMRAIFFNNIDLGYFFVFFLFPENIFGNNIAGTILSVYGFN
jgi:hypothetical protein